MTRRPMPPAPLLALALAACAHPPPSRDTGDTNARRVVDDAVRALGGADALATLRTVRRHMIDNWVDTGQGQHPWTGTPDADHLPVHFPQTVENFLDYAADRWFESQAFRDGPGDYGTQIDTATATSGFESITYADERPWFRALATDELAAQHARRFRRFPEGLLRMLLTSQSLQWVGQATESGQQQDLIAFTDPAGTRLLLSFDAITHRLTRTSIDRDHAILGDTTAETLYADYRRVGPLTLPFLLVDRIAGVPTHKYPIATTELDGAAPAALAPPRDFLPIQPSPPSPTLHPLGANVFEILGPYNAMFAVFHDHVLLVEAPLNETYTEACLALIRSVADKPIRAIATHFHYDHIGGARTLVALDIPIASTPDGIATIRRAITAPHAAHPDRLSKTPRTPRLEPITDQRTFADQDQRVELYDVGPTPHVAQILITYFPKTRTLHVPDLLDVLTPELVIPGVDTLVLIRKIKELHLDVQRIVPVHGVPISLDDLHRGLAVRARHVPDTPLDARPGA